ncbi:MAG: GNAT family N-acetyltransferase [Bacteroidales bacterium]|jgi:diamine N-acetyltransferase|nr:GNAT family N-acetyltransferase [Bacteroidales bacterium]
MRLRAIEFNDIDLIFKWENDESMWDVTETQRPFSHQAIKSYVETAQNEDIYTAKQLRLMIESKTEKQTIGCVDLFDFEPQNLRAGVGILIDKAFRNNGYAARAMELLKKYAFDVINIHNLYAFVPQDNEASLRLFEKAGFNKTATLQDWILRQQNYKDVIVYQCLSVR